MSSWVWFISLMRIFSLFYSFCYKFCDFTFSRLSNSSSCNCITFLWWIYILFWISAYSELWSSNEHDCTSVSVADESSFGFMSKSHTAWSWGRSIPSFLKNCHTDSFNECISLPFHQQWMGVPNTPHPY